MSIDTQNEISTQDSDPSADTSQIAPDTAPSDSSQVNEQDSSAGTEQDTPPQDAPVDQAKSDSLTPPKSVAPNTQETNDTVDPEAYKRLRDEKSQWGRQMAETRRQYEQTRAQLAQFQQERERQSQLAAQQKLALHDFRHPDHASKFQPILAKADIVRQQVNRIRAAKAPDGFTPEQAAQWKQSQEEMVLSTLSEDEHNALNQFNEHSQAFDRKWKLNPASTLHEYVTPMIRQEMQRVMQEQQAAQSVDADLNDPVAGPVIKEMQGEMAEAIERLGGTDEAYEFVKQQAVTYAHNKKYSEQLAQENARLKQQLQEAGIKVASASAQQAFAKGKASITRDVAPRSVRPPYEVAAQWATKNGVSKASPQFFEYLQKIEAERAS